MTLDLSTFDIIAVFAFLILLTLLSFSLGVIYAIVKQINGNLLEEVEDIDVETK